MFRRRAKRWLRSVRHRRQHSLWQKREGRDYIVIDTAGLKKRGKIYEAVDKYAALRALSVIDRSDVVLLVIDAETGIREQDKHVFGYAVEAKKAVVIVVNKWDTVKKDENTMNISSKFNFKHPNAILTPALELNSDNRTLKSIEYKEVKENIKH